MGIVQAQYLGRENYKEFDDFDFKESIELQSEPVALTKGKLNKPIRAIVLKQ